MFWYPQFETIQDLIEKGEITEEVKNSAYQIIEKKGYTNYAVSLAVRRIAEAILRDEHSILSVSSYDEKENMGTGNDGATSDRCVLAGKDGSKTYRGRCRSGEWCGIDRQWSRGQ